MGISMFCKFAGCKNNSRSKYISFHRFPKEEKRCEAWVKASGNAKLIGISAARLHANAVLCSNHFKDWCFMNIIDKKRLVHNAVPGSMKKETEPTNCSKSVLEVLLSTPAHSQAALSLDSNTPKESISEESPKFTSVLEVLLSTPAHAQAALSLHSNTSQESISKEFPKLTSVFEVLHSKTPLHSHAQLPLHSHAQLPLHSNASENICEELLEPTSVLEVLLSTPPHSQSQPLRSNTPENNCEELLEPTSVLEVCLSTSPHSQAALPLHSNTP